MKNLGRALLWGLVLLLLLSVAGGGTAACGGGDGGQDTTAVADRVATDFLSGDGGADGMAVCVPKCKLYWEEVGPICDEEDGCGGICGCPEESTCFWEDEGYGGCVPECSHFCEHAGCGDWFDVGWLYHECDCGLDCDDGNPCTSDSCSDFFFDYEGGETTPETQCLHAFDDLLQCDDGDPSTVNYCKAGVCVACSPDCQGKECGDDGCGGTCGTCSDAQTCNEEGKCVP